MLINKILVMTMMRCIIPNSLYLLTKDEFGEPPASLEGNHDNPVSGTHQAPVNLCNRTGKERRRQTLCDKRDSNFV